MLARGNRVASPDDFRTIVRRGRRYATPTAVYYRVTREPDAPLRFGFIISRTIGPAVHRNQLRRRWRAIARTFVDRGMTGADIVVRALPGCAERPFAELAAEFSDVLARPL